MRYCIISYDDMGSDPCTVGPYETFEEAKMWAERFRAELPAEGLADLRREHPEVEWFRVFRMIGCFESGSGHGYDPNSPPEFDDNVTESQDESSGDHPANACLVCGGPSRIDADGVTSCANADCCDYKHESSGGGS